jgi:hypothetical protein
MDDLVYLLFYDEKTSFIIILFLPLPSNIFCQLFFSSTADHPLGRACSISSHQNAGLLCNDIVPLSL